MTKQQPKQSKTKLEVLRERSLNAEQGGGAERVEKQHAARKMTVLLEGYIQARSLTGNLLWKQRKPLIKQGDSQAFRSSSEIAVRK